jgi:hypothetical protein
MDAQAVADFLADIDRQLAEGEEHICILRDLVADLKNDGHDAGRAEGLVQEALDAQALLQHERRRLVRRIAH